MDRRSFIACVVPALVAVPVAAKSLTPIAPLTPTSKLPEEWKVIIDHATGLLTDAVVYDNGKEVKQIYKVVHKNNMIIMYSKNSELISVMKLSTNWEIHSKNSILMSTPDTNLSADRLELLKSRFAERRSISKIDHSFITEIMKL